MTVTFPEVAFVGTKTLIEVALQLDTVAAVPLKLTVPEDPKLLPLIVTLVPTGPEEGDMPVTGDTVNGTPLLGTPATVTTTFPVVAPLGTGAVILVVLQAVGTAAWPLNVMGLVPWLVPKLAPEIVTATPTPPDVGDKPEMLGACPNASPYSPRSGTNILLKRFNFYLVPFSNLRDLGKLQTRDKVMRHKEQV